MGFKNDDKCLQKVKDDEPIFVLRAQDRLAPALVRLWADLAAMNGAPGEKTEEAMRLADTMNDWQEETGQVKFPD